MPSENAVMPGRLHRLLLCAAAIVAGCAGNTLSADAPPGVNLAGAWKLDRAASDDPQKVLEQMRAAALRLMHRPAAAPPAPARGGVHSTAGELPPPEPDPGAVRGDPLRRSPMAHVLQERLARGDYLSVQQTPGEFVLDFGTIRRSFTPGGHSVVSAEGGVADQTSGWHGREYVIRVHGQSSPDVTERFGLAADGKRLVEKLHIGADELPAVDLTRIYDPTTESAPRQLPISD